MSMSKSSEKKQTQEIDPQLAANSEAVVGLARMLAGLGHQPYTGTNVADFTPQQRAAFDSVDTMSGAFGLGSGVPWDVNMPTPTQSESGIMGFSTHDIMRQNIGEEKYNEIQNFLDKFSSQASQTPKAKKSKSGGGGKK